MEPQLDVDDIQGHLFPGFGTDYSVVLGLKLMAPVEGRAALAALVPEVTTMAESLFSKSLRRETAMAGLNRPAQEKASLAISVAATALRIWGYDTAGFDSSFDAGMRADAASLGDPIGQDSMPVDWRFNTTEHNRVDVLLIAGHTDSGLLEENVERWLSMLVPYHMQVFVEYGRRRTGDKEFFGFKDGVSQPAIRGISPDGEPVSRRSIATSDPRSNLYAKPGQLLIWPGSFVFGYPGQTSALTQAGPPVTPPVPWMRNSSYLVFRRLSQNVPAFREAVRGMEQFLNQKGEQVPEGWVAAHLVGRWPDGTPLTASPKNADPIISDNPDRINNFLFFTSQSPTPLAEAGVPPITIPAVPADPLGLACPRASHIRQVNPRDGISEIGQEHHPGKMLLRRGIAFGPEEEEAPHADRGLLFLAYQTSIVEQFKFMQANWANSTQRPTGDGRDPLIGQDGTLDTHRSIQLFAPSGRQQRCPINGRWVVATGGEYFVTLGISGLRYLLNIDN